MIDIRGCVQILQDFKRQYETVSEPTDDHLELTRIIEDVLKIVATLGTLCTRIRQLNEDLERTNLAAILTNIQTQLTTLHIHSGDTSKTALSDHVKTLRKRGYGLQEQLSLATEKSRALEKERNHFRLLYEDAVQQLEATFEVYQEPAHLLATRSVQRDFSVRPQERTTPDPPIQAYMKPIEPSGSSKERPRTFTQSFTPETSFLQRGSNAVSAARRHTKAGLNRNETPFRVPANLTGERIYVGRPEHSKRYLAGSAMQEQKLIDLITEPQLKARSNSAKLNEHGLGVCLATTKIEKLGSEVPWSDENSAYAADVGEYSCKTCRSKGHQCVYFVSPLEVLLKGPLTEPQKNSQRAKIEESGVQLPDLHRVHALI